MPCIALVAIKTGIFGPYETLIVMLYGTCPGGGISNFFTYYLRLNIDLSGKTIPGVSAREFFGHNFRRPEPAQLMFFVTDRNAYLSQDIKNLDLSGVVSAIKFLHGRVL